MSCCCTALVYRHPVVKRWWRLNFLMLSNPLHKLSHIQLNVAKFRTSAHFILSFQFQPAFLNFQSSPRRGLPHTAASGSACFFIINKHSFGGKQRFYLNFRSWTTPQILPFRSYSYKCLLVFILCPSLPFFSGCQPLFKVSGDLPGSGAAADPWWGLPRTAASGLVSCFVWGWVASEIVLKYDLVWETFSISIGSLLKIGNCDFFFPFLYFFVWILNRS